MRKRSKYGMRRHKFVKNYTLLDEMRASNEAPMPAAERELRIALVRAGIDALAFGESPTVSDWRVVSEAVNVLETITTVTDWKAVDGGIVEVKDGWGTLSESVKELARSGSRHLQYGTAIRLSGPGITILRGVADDYEEVLNALTERSVIRALRLTEQRLHKIGIGQRMPHDVVVQEPRIEEPRIN